MRADRLHLQPNTAISSLPSPTDDMRGQIRILAGDGSTTADALYFARDNAGTEEWTALLAADAPTIATNLATQGDAPAGSVNAATMGNSSALTFATDSNDISGQIEIATGGTGFGAGTYCTITFSTPKSANFDVFISYQSDDARTLGIVGSTGRTVNGFSLAGVGTPSASKTYRWGYLIVERKP